MHKTTNANLNLLLLWEYSKTSKIMATECFKRVYALLLPHLSEEETYKLIKQLFDGISQDNLVKFQQVSVPTSNLKQLSQWQW